jgi:hypothetical protein
VVLPNTEPALSGCLQSPVWVSAIPLQPLGVCNPRVEPQTWEAFRLTACENWQGEDVAAALGMNVTAVFKAKSRVLAFIRQEVRRLDGGS